MRHLPASVRNSKKQQLLFVYWFAVIRNPKYVLERATDFLTHVPHALACNRQPPSATRFAERATEILTHAFGKMLNGALINHALINHAFLYLFWGRPVAK